FTINCTGNPDQNGFYQHSVFLTLADDKMVSSHDDDTTITVVMDHQQYIIPSSLGWRNGDNAWFDFISNISEAGQFDVYVNDHKAGTFTADRKNTEKVLSTLGDCSND
ncbi:protein YkfB, partial [Escherichia coli]